MEGGGGGKRLWTQPNGSTGTTVPDEGEIEAKGCNVPAGGLSPRSGDQEPVPGLAADVAGAVRRRP